MDSISVDLKLFSHLPHLSQILSGFLLLKKEGFVKDLNISFERPQKGFEAIIQCFINNNYEIFFDVFDGYNNDYSVFKKCVKEADFYFKRSYSDKMNICLLGPDLSKKVRKLGFNYHVSIEGNPLDIPISIKERLKSYARSFLGRKNSSYFVPSVFESPPNKTIKNNIKILFLTRTWRINESKQSPEYVESVSRINNMRIEIVRELRKMGDNIICGFSKDSPYIPDKNLLCSKYLTNRSHYLNIMKSSDICIGSTGLHNSIGWKTGEYVAAGRCIINERFNYEVPGEFKERVNYLPFETSEECIQSVLYLLKNPQRIDEIKAQNLSYYNNFLRPDVLVKNAIIQVIG